MSSSPSRKLKGRRVLDKDLTTTSLESKLISAAESGNSALVKRLIKKGADIHHVENRKLGYNALHYAAFNGYYDVVEDLLLAGADVNRITTDHYSPLMLAALGGFTDVVEHMFRISKPDLAIRTKDSNEVQDGLTCLHLAVVSGSDATVRLLIAQGAEREAVTNAGYTALHLAAEAGLPHIVATLLGVAPSLYGSASSQALRYTAQGRTALHLAVLSGVRDSVQLLLADDPAEANIPDQDGYTPLHLAVLHQYRDIADLLLRQGVAVDTHSTQEGRTPLLDAVTNRDAKSVDKLLQYSADPTTTDQNGATPLLLAAEYSSERIVRSLLDSLTSSASVAARRQALHAQDQAGNTALHLAVEAAHSGIAKRLVDAGASSDVPNKAGVTALDLADQQNNRKMQALLRREVRPLSDHDADGSPASTQGKEVPDHLDTPASADSRACRDPTAEAAVGEPSLRETPTSPVQPPSADFSAKAMEGETVSVRVDGDGTEWTCRTRRAPGSDASWEEVLSCTSGADGEVVEALVSYAADHGHARPVVARSGGEEGEASFSAGSNWSSPDTESPGSASPRRRGRHVGHHREDPYRAAKAERVRQLRRQLRERRQERRRKRAASRDSLSGPEVGQCSPGVADDTGAGPEGVEPPPVREQAEAALYHLRAQYELRLQEVSAQYEARIAALQAQLRDLHGLNNQESHPSPGIGKDAPTADTAGEQLNSSLDWDQEIEFSHGSPRCSPRPGRKQRKRHHHPSPQAVGVAAEGASPETEATGESIAPAASVRRRHRHRSSSRSPSRSRRQSSADPAQLERAAEGCSSAAGAIGCLQQEGVRGTVDQTCRAAAAPSPPAEGAIMLTDFERFFLDALSMVLVLTAIALLLFVRYRLH